jgi:hypothetical protein
MSASFTCSLLTFPVPVADGAVCCALSNGAEASTNMAKEKWKAAVLLISEFSLLFTRCSSTPWQLESAVATGKVVSGGGDLNSVIVRHLGPALMMAAFTDPSPDLEDKSYESRRSA